MVFLCADRFKHKAIYSLLAVVLVVGYGLSVPTAVEAAPVRPVLCVVSVDGGSVEVSWPEVVGADEYVVYRSVNGSPDYWRGRVSGLGFVDSNRSGSIVYKVASKFGAVRSDRVTCTSDDDADRTNPVPDADFLAVGDFARCNPDGATEVGNLLDDLPQPIWGLGDYAYPDGTPEQFNNCFDPKLGRHKQRFSPVVGNHEYNTPGATGYFGYFGSLAGDPTKGYYSQDHGNWQVLFLNTNCGQVACNQGSQQYQWLQAQLEARPNVCRAVVMHHPRWSSYGPYASANNLGDLTQLFYDAGTDIVLTGHAHHYERLDRVDPNQQVDTTSGFRQFTVGTGGIGPRTPHPDDILSVSQKIIVGEFGVLALDLRPDSYSWSFVDVDKNILDSGSDNCVN